MSEMSEERVEKPEDVVKKGDVVKAMVISIDKDSKKIALSMKSAVNSEATESYEKAEMRTSTMADKLKDFKVD